LHTGDVEHVEYERRLEDFLHNGEELGVDVVETLRFDRKEMFDVGTSREDTSVESSTPSVELESRQCERTHSR